MIAIFIRAPLTRSPIPGPKDENIQPWRLIRTRASLEFELDAGQVARERSARRNERPPRAARPQKARAAPVQCISWRRGRRASVPILGIRTLRWLRRLRGLARPARRF